MISSRRNASSSHPFRVFAALALALTCAGSIGCGKKSTPDLRASLVEVRNQISTIVPDSARAGRIREAYDRMDSALVQSARRRGKLSDRMRALYRDYDAPRESLEAVVAGEQQSARAFREQAMSIRDEVRSLTSAKEWKELASGRKKLAHLYLEGGK